MDRNELTFQSEQASACFNEVKPLLEAHWAETAPPYVALDPDWEAYRACEAAGLVRAYSIRVNGEMKGYALYFVRPSIHARGTLMASQDLLYVDPEFRSRSGAWFIRWCNKQLKAEGVMLVTQHVTTAVNFGPLLERLGYDLTATFWTKRLL